jgi:Icc-related predicted phosphoesterase
MKIVVISDTHTKHSKLTIPECDVLVHCGDFTYQGKYWKVKSFYSWLREQPAKHKVVIAGNHEETFDRNHPKYNPACKAILADCPDENIHYLENQALVIEGIRFYGTPWTPAFYDWAFNGVTDADLPFTRSGVVSLSEMYNKIPEDTQVLICHGPPYDILDRSERGDERTGSVEMRKLTSEKLIQLRLYLCGHIHEARGMEVADGGVTFVNASSLGRDYQTISQPIIVTLDEYGSVESVEGLEEE